MYVESGVLWRDLPERKSLAWDPDVTRGITGTFFTFFQAAFQRSRAFPALSRVFFNFGSLCSGWPGADCISETQLTASGFPHGT